MTYQCQVVNGRYRAINGHCQVVNGHYQVGIGQYQVRIGQYQGKTGLTKSGTKRVAMAPFELKISPNGSYRRAASFETPPGTQNAHI